MLAMVMAHAVTVAAAFGTSASAQRVTPVSATSHSRISVLTASTSMPSEWESPVWLPDLQACCSLVKAAGSSQSESDIRMGSVLEWLQMMLVQIELGDEDEELDEDFVSTARPWLHAKAFHDVTCEPADFTSTIWKQISDSEYLKPNAEGGTLLLLLPTQLPYSLFADIVDSVRVGVQSNFNTDIAVLGCHPDAEMNAQKAPVPLLRVFLD